MLSTKSLVLALLLVIAASANQCPKPSKPHIIFILSDDYGWANVGYHNPNNSEVVTPNLNALKESGIELDRHYVYKFCSPSRSALLSGRNPIHVHTYNGVRNYNPENNVTGFAGIPLRMTLVSEKLKQAGYTTRHTGKWDVGLATKHHLAVNRGFDSSFGYLQHANDYWGYNASCGAIDMWSGNTPAYNNSPADSCAYENQVGCDYVDELLVKRVLREINQHDPSEPLFYYWAMHGVHNPLQPIQSYYDQFSSIENVQRRQLAAMVKYMDESIGRVTDKLKEKGMWENSIIVWSSDNGGPVNSLKVGATNYPLRGGKTTNFEGGIRVNAFVTGGLVPEHLRGTKSEDFIAIWDWYSTFCGIAGVDPTDAQAAAFNLPPIDSYNMWPLLTKQTTVSPRAEIPIGLDNDGLEGVNVVVQGIIVPPYKLLYGINPIAWWQGYVFPNASTNIKQLNQLPPLNCTHGCLWNILTDPSESKDISAANPAVVSQLAARIQYHQATVLSVYRGEEDPAACVTAFEKYSGFMGPWVDIDFPVWTPTTTGASATTASNSLTTASAATSTGFAATTGGAATTAAAATTSAATTTGGGNYDHCGVTFTQTKTGAWGSSTQWLVTITTGNFPLYAAEIAVVTSASSFEPWNIDAAGPNVYTIPAWRYHDGAIPAHSSDVTFGYTINSATAASFKLNNEACVISKPCPLTVSSRVTSTWTGAGYTYESVTLDITSHASTEVANTLLHFNFYNGAFISGSWNLAPATTTAAQTSKNITCNLFNLKPGDTSTSCGYTSQVLTNRAAATNIDIDVAQSVCL